MRRTGTLMIVLGWLLLAGVVWLAMDGWVDQQEAPNARVSMAAGEVVLQRNRAGHYLAPGEVNGVPVTFLVDTGASGVALSSKVADLSNVAELPRITYKSTNVVFSGDNPSRVEGNLTLLGVTRPVTLDVAHGSSQSDW